LLGTAAERFVGQANADGCRWIVAAIEGRQEPLPTTWDAQHAAEVKGWLGLVSAALREGGLVALADRISAAAEQLTRQS
jgi:hypothetical protein